MITIDALEARNRARAESPVVIVVSRRRAAVSDDAIRFVSAACRELEVDAVAVDVDELSSQPASASFLDELGVRFVPEVLVFARGVLLERTTVASAADARAVLALTLRRHRRPVPKET